MTLRTVFLAFLLIWVPTVAGAQQPDAEQQKAEALFKAGQAALRAGRPDLTVTYYRHLASVAPTLRVKLELARALYLTGQYAESLSLFKEVYLHPETPQTVRRNILPFMEEDELRLTRVRYGARIVTDSNPSRVSEGGTIYFNGTPLEYQPPTPKKISYGIEPWLSVEKLWKNGLLTKFYGSARLFKDEDLISGHLQSSVARQVPGTHGLFLQASIDVGMNAGINEDSSYLLPSLEAWKRFRLSDKAGVGIGGQIGYLTSKNRNISGPFYRPYLFGDWTFLPNATAFARFQMEHLNSRNDYYSYVAPRLDFGVALRTHGLELTPQIMVSRARYSQYDAFWGVTRKDLTLRPTLTFSHDKLEWHGLRPEISVFYEARNSNIDIYDYDQIGGFLNVRKLF